MEDFMVILCCAVAVIFAIIVAIELVEENGDWEDNNQTEILLFLCHCMGQVLRARAARVGRRRHENRSCWAYPRPQTYMERLLLGSYSDRMFKSRLRLSRETFEFLTARIAPQLQRSNTNYRKAISIEKRVCVALHRLASGSNLQVIADLYGISTSAAQKIVIDFSDAMLSSGLHDLYIKWPSLERMQSLAREFEAIQGIPYVIGAVDGSHIPIIAPRAHHEDYFNRKGFHSIILQMTVASNCAIWDYDIGWAGSLHDWNVFQRSELGQRCEAGALGNYCLLGDCAYPARFWMLAPFKGSKDGLLPERYHWNYIQSSSRMPVERAFGMLKARFRILLKRCDMLLQNVPKMVRACLVLHNMCIVHADAFDEGWVREAQVELQRAQMEVAATSRDAVICSGLNEALAEHTYTLESEPSLAVDRVQDAGIAPLDPAHVSGAHRRDNISRVMFTEKQRKCARMVFGDEDSADESFESD
ncbi:hypothetical protein L7F22_039908 [Adiantum nelumboides]|nr:hypothetical protein [Adiantum nelumboides]